MPVTDSIYGKVGLHYASFAKQHKKGPIGSPEHPAGHWGHAQQFDEKWDEMFSEQSAMWPDFFVDGQRKRINLVAIIINLFMPWFMFSLLFTMLSFEFHYEHPAATWLTVLGSAVIVLIIASLAYRNRGRKSRTPMWFLFATGSLSCAFCLGVICGNLNFQYNTMPSYEINSLNTYPHVDPSVETGTQLMDAGKVYFAEGTKLDFKKAMGFKSEDMYCVAPITMGSDELESYDFWAVGVNCCSGTTSDFRCGQFNNPKARSGMRQISDYERPFFRLAVQEAEAAYHIKSTHPIFFYWVQDPLADLDANAKRGWKLFLTGMLCFLGVNSLAVGLAIIGFSKLGHQPVF